MKDLKGQPAPSLSSTPNRSKEVERVQKSAEMLTLTVQITFYLKHVISCRRPDVLSETVLLVHKIKA